MEFVASYNDAPSKAEAVEDNLESSFIPQIADDSALPWIRQVKRTLQQDPIEEDDIPFSPTETREISHLLKTAPRGPAPGPDRITYSMLSHLPPNTLRRLVCILNSDLRLQLFPSEWKHAVVITLPKPSKNPIIPQNRRPISLLSTLGKLFERIITRRMLPHIKARSLIPDVQFGFTPTRSTTLQLLRLAETISTGFINRESTVAIFLDIHKAYDSTWHQGLLYKLRTFQFSLPIQRILASYLDHRTFQVREENAQSSTRPKRAGVPQGAVLSPLLYNLYTADVPSHRLLPQRSMQTIWLCIFELHHLHMAPVDYNDIWTR